MQGDPARARNAAEQGERPAVSPVGLWQRGTTVKTRSVQERIQRSLVPLTIVSGLAAAVYLVTGRVFLPIVLVGGAVAGGLSAAIAEIRGAAHDEEDSRRENAAGGVSPRSRLLHERLVVRFAALLVVGGLVFLVAWGIGYAVLPEGAVRDASAPPGAVLTSRGATLHVTILGWLSILGQVVFLAMGIFVFSMLAGLGAYLTPEGSAGFLVLAGALLGGMLVVLALPGMLAGYGLLRRKAWGRILALIVGFLNLPNFPLGTALALYTF